MSTRSLPAKPTGCSRCGSEHLHARRLCKPCYDHEWRAGRHIDTPGRYRRRADVVEDYLLLRAKHSRAEIAQILGMKLNSLHAALRKAAIAGDDRIDYTPGRDFRVRNVPTRQPSRWAA